MLSRSPHPLAAPRRPRTGGGSPPVITGAPARATAATIHPFTPRPARRRDDALQRWAGLRAALQQRFQELGLARPDHRALPRRRLMLALELVWKLEELALLPALIDADAGTRSDAAELSRELALLRDLAALVQDEALDAAAASVVIAALEGMADLRALRFERALAAALKTGQLDGPALAAEMEGLLARWNEEIATTGDIEDEEADPVGRPPR